MNLTVLHFDTLESTNTEAAEHARRGVDEGLCIVADEQTAGRGRQGREWASPKGSGLYLSVLLRPKVEPKYLTLITLMAGVAVHDLLASYRLKPDIKWVNDILVDDRKICGILAESLDTPTGVAVVLGIGINLKSRNFPSDVGSRATSIKAELATTETVSIDDLARNVMHFIEFWYEVLNGEDGPAKIVKHWQWRSSYSNEKFVRVTLANESIDGTTCGIEDNGALRVRRADGSVTIVQAGDVERLRSV